MYLDQPSPPPPFNLSFFLDRALIIPRGGLFWDTLYDVITILDPGPRVHKENWEPGPPFTLFSRKVVSSLRHTYSR